MEALNILDESEVEKIYNLRYLYREIKQLDINFRDGLIDGDEYDEKVNQALIQIDYYESM